MNRYSYGVAALKAALTIAFAAIVAEIAIMDLPTTIEEWKSRAPVIGLILLSAAGRALKNAYKNSDLKGSPFYNIMRTWMLFILIPALTLPGCVGFTPALAGKTRYDMEFIDKTAEQDTQFRVNIAAPAGVEVANLASMNYKWQPDGGGAIAVAGDTTADTTAQAQTLEKVGAQQVQALVSLLAILPTLAPLLQALRPAPAPPAAGIPIEPVEP